MRILLLIIVSYLLSMFFSFSLTFLIMVLFLSILLIYDVIKYRSLKDEKFKTGLIYHLILVTLTSTLSLFYDDQTLTHGCSVCFAISIGQRTGI